jgi:hypothetical protein
MEPLEPVSWEDVLRKQDLADFEAKMDTRLGGQTDGLGSFIDLKFRTVRRALVAILVPYFTALVLVILAT